MIELIRVSKAFKTNHGEKVILDDVSFKFERGKSVGLLGRNGVGKTTVLRMLSGVMKPTSGKIRRSGKISWPLAFGGAIHGGLSARDNIMFAARIYGEDVRHMVDRVEDLAELGDYMDMPVRTYSSGMRSRLSLALSLAIEFDVYLVDEIPGVADLRFQKRYREILKNALNKSDVIMISHNPRSIQEYCDQCVLLEGGKLHDFGSIDQALNAHGEFKKLAVRQVLGRDDE